jgi:hypothetical protein
VDAFSEPDRIEPAAVRYIKLGAGGAWLAECLERDALMFTDRVPHAVAVAGDWDRARQIYAEAGETQITDRIREISAFYQAGPNELWITFGQGRLWWALAAPGVIEGEGGVRIRRTLAPWSDRDRSGRILRTDGLSSSLTQTASYQRTICTVAAREYLLRRLNADLDPLALQADTLMAELTRTVRQIIAELHWRDFEVLVDLIVTRGGWRRIAAVGGSGQADSDLILEQPVTGERAFVQIKSKATAATFRECLGKFERYPEMDRFIFACHTASAGVSAPEGGRVQLWLGDQLAAKAVAAGLVDWLLARRT